MNTTKLKGEKQLQAQTEKHTIVGLSWLYGPNSDNLVYKFVQTLYHLQFIVERDISTNICKIFVNDMLVAISEILNDPDTLIGVESSIIHIKDNAVFMNLRPN